jgi:hypothetical protein
MFRVTQTSRVASEKPTPNRPDARAAIADAAFVRSCGNVHAAMQPTSWKRPFKATISVDFKPTFRRVMFELTHRGLFGPSACLRE